MGNSSSSSGKAHSDDTVDFGFLVPQGVYTGPRDWNQVLVTQFICARRLAPFYRPLEDYDESWDDDRILAARKEPPDPEHQGNNETVTRVETGNSAHSTKSSLSRKAGPPKEVVKPDAAIYRGAVECPICFLYYPPNINHSRCCDQAICTECFVQIKRNEPTPTHLVSEPAACPYCVQDNFGIVYKPPSWRAGIGSEGFNSESRADTPSYATHKRRQKTVVHDAPEVVTIDHIRPDWEAKLAAVQAAVARRANRRIIMRQVGDRLIPVGVTSGRVHAINAEDAQSGDGEQGSGSNSRRRRRQQQHGGQTLDQFLGSMGMAGPDLEELMVMEAMRLSLLEHEAQQRKEEEEKKKNGETASPDAATIAGGSSAQQVDSPDSSTPGASDGSSQRQVSSSSLQANETPSSSSNLRETAERWRVARSTSPPAFSTLRAAISAASTAGAVLAQPPEEPETVSRADEPPAPSLETSASTASTHQPQPVSGVESLATTSSPSRTKESTTSHLSAESESPVAVGTTPTEYILSPSNGEASDSVLIPEQVSPSLPNNGIRDASISQSSLLPIPTPSYDVLPSSPETTETSSSDRKPLIAHSDSVSSFVPASTEAEASADPPSIKQP
jgi:hypothetical protein